MRGLQIRKGGNTLPRDSGFYLNRYKLDSRGWHVKHVHLGRCARMLSRSLRSIGFQLLQDFLRCAALGRIGAGVGDV